MEVMQLVIRSVSRSFEAADILANVIGVISGIVAAFLFSPFIVRLIKK
jgi:glycopeptide antibiotics resistance protein